MPADLPTSHLKSALALLEYGEALPRHKNPPIRSRNQRRRNFFGGMRHTKDHIAGPPSISCETCPARPRGIRLRTYPTGSRLPSHIRAGTIALSDRKSRA